MSEENQTEENQVEAQDATEAKAETTASTEEAKAETAKDGAPKKDGPKGKRGAKSERGGRKPRNKKDNNKADGEEWFERVIKINRVMKACKGGKRLGFRALVVVGDLNGKVGIGLGKSSEVPGAIKKAMDRAKKNLVTVTVLQGTLAHSVKGRFGSAKVLVHPAPEGTGIIAGGAARIILEAAGIRNAVAKSLGSSNPINSARATLQGLLSLRNQETESKRRGVKLSIRKPVVAEAV